jgi:protein-S-isoprenylcysteine O-methyltransferase Ste14
MLGIWLMLLLVPVNIVGRIVVAHRRAGDGGLRISRADLRGWAGVAGATGLAAWLVAAGFAASGESSSPLRAIGVVVFLAGLGSITWAQSAMGDSWRIGVDPHERTTLVVRPPFNMVRNPIYSGMALSLLGIALVSTPPVSLIGPGLWVVFMEIQARLVEEPHLTSMHTDYRSYAARVGRFVPGVGH